jgi:hypothetical protein
MPLAALALGAPAQEYSREDFGNRPGSFRPPASPQSIVVVPDPPITDFQVIEPRPGDERIRDGRFSPVFPVDSSRVVDRIEVEWNDRRQDARGSLVVNGEPRSRWRPADVSSPGRHSWQVGDRVHDFAIAAVGDDIDLSRLIVHYLPGSGPTPFLPPGGHDHAEFSFGEAPLHVSEGRFSPPLPLDPGRTVAQVDVVWRDSSRTAARGQLILESAVERRFARKSVRDDGEAASWAVYDRGDAIRIRAYGGSLRILRIVVHYEECGCDLLPAPPGVYFPGVQESALRAILLDDALAGPVFVPAGTYSHVFANPNSRRPVARIRVRWHDRDEESRGHLLINDEQATRFRSKEVETPGEVTWEVDGPVYNLRFYAEADSLFLTEVALEYR